MMDQETSRDVADRDVIVPKTSGAGRFDLNPSQQLPLTVFVF